MLAQQVFSIPLGYEDLNDQQTMRTRAALLVAAGLISVDDEPIVNNRWHQTTGKNRMNIGMRTFLT